jgi:hypothetical protein
MKIAVYCSSREDLEEKFVQPAIALGRWIGEHGHTLVYGGVKSGLMHTVAQATHDAGGKVLGVVPDRFKHRTDAVVDQVVNCQDLGDRKTIMIDNAQLFVVLPGGLGTLDEWLSTLSQIIVNNNDTRDIIVVNIDNLYSAQLKQLEETAQSPFARGKHIDKSIAVASSEEMIFQLDKISTKNEK